MRIFHTIEIGADPEQVFYYLEDPIRAREWMSSVTKTEIIEKTSDMVGTTFRETVEEEGAGTELRGVVTEFEPNRRIAFHLEGKFNTVDVAYTLRESGKTSEPSQNAVILFKGWLGVLALFLGPVFKKKILDQARGELAKLKEISEGKAGSDQEQTGTEES